MKNTLYLTALLSAGLLIGSCSKVNEQIIEPEQDTETPAVQAGPVEMSFTTTITAKDSATKSVDAEGVTAWQVDEKIAVYYQKEDDTFATAEANVDAVESGSATISATLTDAKNGTEVKFIYPATLANTTGGINTETLQAQHGTIADISAHFDAATGTGTLVTDGTTCGTESSVHMYNQAFIGKFTPKFGGSPIDGITELTISDGTYTYTVTPEDPADPFGTSGIYVAMLPVTAQSVSLTGRTASQSYSFAGVEATFAAGNMYTNLAIPMVKGMLVSLANISDDYILVNGDVVTGTLGSNIKLTIADGASVTLEDATINGISNSSYSWAGLNLVGDATIVLKGENTVKGFYQDWPGIFVPEGKTVTIRGDGSLNASSNGYGAGIGGGYYIACGNIRIEGGTITATGDHNAAGIGGGLYASCGDITITSSVTKVTAIKGSWANYSIGAGLNGTVGTVTIGDETGPISTSPYTYQP